MSLMYSYTARLSIRTYDPLVKSVTLDIGSPRENSERSLDLHQNLALRDPTPPFQVPCPLRSASCAMPFVLAPRLPI